MNSSDNKMNENLSNKHHTRNLVLAWIIIGLSLVSIVVLVSPCLPYQYHNYANGTPPIIETRFVSPLISTYADGNPIAIISIGISALDTVLSAFSLKIEKKWLKRMSYVLFIVSLFFLVASVLTGYICANNKNY